MSWLTDRDENSILRQSIYRGVLLLRVSRAVVKKQSEEISR